MKKCPSCNSLSQDSSDACGICGTTLSDIASKDLGSLENEITTKVTPRTRVPLKGVVILMAGIAVLGVGVYMLFASVVIGLFLLLAGVTITASILGVSGSTVGTPSGGRVHKSTGWRGKDSAVRRDLIESENHEKRKRGESD